jgi:hypothetical protein
VTSISMNGEFEQAKALNEKTPSIPQTFSIRQIAELNNLTNTQVIDVLDQAFRQGPVQVNYP